MTKSGCWEQSGGASTSSFLDLELQGHTVPKAIPEARQSACSDQACLKQALPQKGLDGG